LGACHNYPLVYQHAHTSLQGLALPDLYIEQAISQIGLILTHGAIDTPTGSLLHALLEQAQLKVGIGTAFLSTSFPMYGFLLNDCFWKSVWHFISTHGITLSYVNQVLPYPQHTGDAFLMESFIELKGITRADLLTCNCCQLALSTVSSLADITTGDGFHIQEDCTGMVPSLTQCSQWDFPVKHPSTQDKACWRTTLKSLTSNTYELPLHQHLGTWIASPDMEWEWFYHPHNGTLY
jgi:hypothetical protein